MLQVNSNVPDYRARKLAGTGPVDGNKPSSAPLPTTDILKLEEITLVDGGILMM